MEVESENRIDLCKICLKTNGKYTCPRCNIVYCSLDCYKSVAHSECSESFYQEWVETELKNQEPDSNMRNKMLNILKKYSKPDDGNILDSDDDKEDDEAVPDISERLNGINLDDPDEIWKNLTLDERNAFKEIMKTGEATKLIPLWEPWWIPKYEEPKVQELDTASTSKSSISVDQTYIKYCPTVVENIPKLSGLTKVPPASNVIFNLFNILGGYSVVMRHFNGDSTDFVDLAVTLFFKISQSLARNEDFYSLGQALEAVALKAIENPFIEFNNDNKNKMKKDVEKIFNGPCKNDRKFYIQAALSDMRKLFSSKTLTKNKQYNKGSFKSSFPQEFISDAKYLTNSERKMCLKRLEYFQSFVLDYNFK